MSSKTQTERIEYYEKLFDEVSAAAAQLKTAVDGFNSVSDKINELEKYYSGKDWKKDFTDDEKGKLPPDLKRGVLSEDGLYNLFDEIRELRKNFNNEL
jgi:hypothetical protein